MIPRSLLARTRRALHRLQARPAVHRVVAPTPTHIENSRYLEAARLVESREQYVREHGVDPAFAMPGGNWSFDAPNEFLKVYLRVLADEEARSYLRFFCAVFTGYSLYWVRDAKGLTLADVVLDVGSVTERLTSSNAGEIAHWLSIRDEDATFSPPQSFGECGHRVGGVIVNRDTVAYQERVTLLRLSGLLDRLQAPRIVEIGGGYGALARWFLTTFPGCSYTIVDLPECLLFPSIYLDEFEPSFGLPESSVRLVPNYMAERLKGPFDIVINTLSMSEMTEFQVRRYAELIHGWGPFFEQNTDNRQLNMLSAQEILKECFQHRELVAADRPLHRGTASVWT